MRKFRDIKEILIGNVKVVENYFFMTVLQVVNSLFYLLLYPYLIRTLGSEFYGLYIFALSITTYFISIVQYGFDPIGLKTVSLNINDILVQSKTFSCVFYSKLILLVLSFVVFIAVMTHIEVFLENRQLFYLVFMQTASFLFLPTWFYQALQKMKIITIVQLLVKVLSLPIIFLFIKSKADLNLFALIIGITVLLSSLISFIVVIKFFRVKIVKVALIDIFQFFKDGAPFFLTNVMNTVKQQTVTVFIGMYFTMTDVALYDLAFKILTVPVTFIANINSALFPKMITNNKIENLYKILKVENLIGVLIVIFLVVFGKLFISVLGGAEMLGAYWYLIIISFSVFTMLTVGAIFNFYIIPLGKYKYIAYNQFIALVSFILFSFFLLIITKSPLSFPAAIALSTGVEYFYSYRLLYTMQK